MNKILKVIGDLKKHIGEKMDFEDKRQFIQNLFEDSYVQNIGVEKLENHLFETMFDVDLRINYRKFEVYKLETRDNSYNVALFFEFDNDTDFVVLNEIKYW